MLLKGNPLKGAAKLSELIISWSGMLEKEGGGWVA